MPNQTRAEAAEQTTNDLRPWLTFPEMLTILNVSRNSLCQLIAEGEVHGMRLRDRAGAPYRFHPDEPTRYLAANAVRKSA